LLNEGVKEMPRKKAAGCCASDMKAESCCSVESVISVDERGQMVLPKEMRDRAGIKPGDKFALISWDKDGKVCCMSLIRVEEFAGMVENFLGPMMKNIIKAE
jgi:antitoxin PrlF